MEFVTISPRHHKVLNRLSNLPKRILSVHGIDNLSELVLHDLSAEHCFNLEKAAYFVDNPDFNCFNGVAGFNQQEKYPDADHIWDKPDTFSQFMRRSPFNQQVQDIQRPSCRRAKITDEQIVAELAPQLGIKNPRSYAWNLKHDNHGILIFEHDEHDTVGEELLHGLCVLGFCNVF